MNQHLSGSDNRHDISSLIIPAEVARTNRTNREFIALLNLGRMVNTIQFALSVLRESPPDGTPADTRQGVNAFLFCGSLLFEGIRHVNVLAEKYPSFDHLGPFKKPYDDPALERFEETVLKTIRNKIVSHFDDDVFIDSLRHTELEDAVFAQRHTDILEDMVFTLSDELVLGYVTRGYTGTWSPAPASFIGLVEEMITRSRTFIRLVVELITAVMTEKGWVERS